MRICWFAAAAIAYWLLVVRARADSVTPVPGTPARRIAMEAHVGDPSSRTRIVEPVLRDLERRGYASRPASIVKLLGSRAPRPGIVDHETTVAAIVALSERGFDAFNQAEYKDAVAVLALATEQIKRNPALLALDAAHARTAFRAFIGLALSQAKLGHTADSIETMTEAIRSFSTQTVSRAEYGPQAEQFYRTVQKQAHAMGHGQLGIAVDDPRALVFVNGELHGTGKASLPGLIPGAYRVFVQVPGSDGRQYDVAVHAGEASTLEINWQVDSALTISDTWAGFAYASEAERAGGKVLATEFARHWELDALVIVDAFEVEAEQAVQGTVYRTDGTIARSALVVPGGNPTKLYALASYLADGTPSGDLRMVTAPRSLGVRARDANPGGDHPRRAAWSLVIGGAVVISAGIGLLAIDQDFGHTDAQGVRTAYYRDTAPFGVAAGVAGAASIGIGLWLMRTQPHRSQPRVSLAPSRFVLAWTVDY